jgi:hypothetical protein
MAPRDPERLRRLDKDLSRMIAWATFGGVFCLSVGVANLASGDWLRLGAPLKDIFLVMGAACLVEALRERWMREFVRQDRLWSSSMSLNLYALVEGAFLGACIAYFGGRGPIAIAAGIAWCLFGLAPLVAHLVWRAKLRT